MAHIEPWEREPTQDRLNIFVSSRLKECADERVVARDSIAAINHNPVLFEHLGARPYKARNLYLFRLRDSTIMVAIHRLGYGYIDTVGGMKISGLEDEFDFALQNGIPILLYVYSDNDQRELRLAELIKRAESAVTVHYYSNPEELRRISDDATAEITRLVLKPQKFRDVIDESPEALLARTVKRQGSLIDRGELLAELETKAQNTPVLCVHGGAGTGKTTLVAQFSDTKGHTYIRLTGLAPLDVFSLCSLAVTTGEGGEVSHTTLTGARLAFSSAWAEREDVCLIVDECDFVDELFDAIEAAGGTNEQKRFVFTSRTPRNKVENFHIPPLSEDEVRALLRDAGVEFPPGASGPFTPLDVQMIIGDAELIRSQPSPRAREVMTYLALSPSALTAEDLLKLLGDDKITPDTLFEEIKSIGRLLDDGPSGFRIMHAQTAASLADQVRQSPQKFQFFANRLIRLFEQRFEYGMAYRLAEQIGTEATDRLARPTLRQATMLGEHRLGLDVANRMLAKAADEGNSAEIFSLIISLIYPLELVGNAVRAHELLGTAEKLAEKLGERERAAIAEVKLASRARRTLADSDVQGLEDVHNQYIEMDENWNAGRVAIELSALYISSKQFDKAVEILRPALDVFKGVGDEYGVDIVERNLATSLAALPETDAEVNQFVRRIAARSAHSSDTRRQRAWYLNILTRRHRTSGRLSEAEKAAQEILQISEELGDEALSALTYVNLGNVYSDMRDAKRALEAYDRAGNLAQRCGRRDVEADSSRLRASVLNDLEDSAEVAPDRFDQARVFAHHAIGLMEGTIYHEALARAYVELADAQEHLGKEIDSARAYFSAAIEFQKIPDNVGYNAGLIRGVELALDCGNDEFYVAELARVFRVELDTITTLGEQFIQLIRPIISNAPKDHFLRILGRHMERIRSEFPPLLRPLILKALRGAIEQYCRDGVESNQVWRPLYAGLIAPFLAQDTEDELLLRRLAIAITDTIDGLSVRYTENSDTVWTVALGTDDDRVITISPLDDTPGSLVAAQSLALFLKAFEVEFLELAGDSDLAEFPVKVATFSEMPGDMQELARTMGDIDSILENQSVLVTRTEDFSGETPAIVWLHADFLSRASTGVGVSGSLQHLFALSLSELLFVLLSGEVDDEQIRPKVVSLVRQTLS